MMNDHSKERPDGYLRIHLSHSPIALSPAQVSAQEIVGLFYVSLPEHVREFVAFERCVQKQSMKVAICLVVFERGNRQLFEHCPIVFAIYCLFYDRANIQATGIARFVIENRRIEILFGGEVPKDNCLRDARGLGNLFRGRTAKSSLRKNSDRDSDDFRSARLSGHSRLRRPRFVSF
jgi:hypothetical protein